MKFQRGLGVVLLSVAFLGLAGCESAKDKAARHLASALELAEKGDKARAVVEFRNVFQLDPENLEARRDYAKFLLDQGDLGAAYAQYQAVIDRKPDDQEALRQAATLAAQMGNWPEAGRQAKALLALAPGDGALTALALASDYAAAAAKGDGAGRAKAEEEAKRQLVARPEDLNLRRIVIDARAQDRDYVGAMAALEAAQKLYPDDQGLYALRVSLQAALEDKAGVEASLLEMDKRFADPRAGETLLRWYLSNGQADKAEAWLRDKAATPGAAGLAARVQLILLLKQVKDADAALAELDGALKQAAALPADTEKTAEKTTDAAAAPVLVTPVTVTALRVLGASILFDDGRRDAGIAGMKAILANPGTATAEELNMVKVTVARMYMTVGDQVQARALAEEVLKADAGNVEASKLKGGWLIDEDKTDEAIATLRGALEAAPRDAQVMSLLAEAYGRSGARDLQADMLAQAVEASGKAVDESLAYANFLVTDQKYMPAETILINALRLAPADLRLLAAMGDLYLRMKDWPRAEGVASRLEELATPEARALAGRIRPAVLAGRDSTGAAIDYLKGLATQEGGALGDKLALIQAYLAEGKSTEARALADALLAQDPKGLQARYVMAAVKGATGDGAGAVADLRALVAEAPQTVQAWVALIRQTSQQEGQPAAGPLIEEALGHLPDQPDLLSMKAALLEANQDIEGAIAIYDKLYALHSDNLVLANNLASLLSSYRSDQASLERAWAVARRLNGTEVPAFADTYGWLAQLRGQTAEALPYLEKAAQGLDQDPMVHFHYAEALKAAGQADQARAQYARVLELVPQDDSRAFVAAARKAAAE